jgi:hypothetical protein
VLVVRALREADPTLVAHRFMSRKSFFPWVVRPKFVMLLDCCVFFFFLLLKSTVLDEKSFPPCSSRIVPVTSG